MSMMTPIHAGSEDYFKQLNGLKLLPSDPHTLQYLTQLLNNPNSPFEKFLIGGKIQQIEKDLAAQKGMQAQAQVGGGLPTIKDKLQQSASTLAAQTAMAGKGPMPRPVMPMPASQATVQPEEEETTQAAYGGIMHAPVDEHMFNFAPGGIVAFAGKDDQRVRDEAKNQTDAYLAGLEIQNQANAAPPGEASYTPTVDTTASAPAPVVAPDPNAAQRAATRRDLMRLPAAALDILQSPMAAGLNLLGAGATHAGNLGAKVLNAVTDKDILPTNMNLYPGFSMQPFSNRLNASAPVAAPAPAQPGAPSIPKDQIPVMPGPAAGFVPRNPSIIPGYTAPSAPSARPPAVGGGITQVAPSATVVKPAQQDPEIKKWSDNYSKAMDAYVKAVPKDKSVEDIVKEIKDSDIAFGVGNYEDWAKKQLEERQKRHAKEIEGRGINDVFSQLAAFSRPGARWSDVINTDIQNKARHLEEDRQFQNLQDQYEENIYKTAEERARGNAKELRAAMKDQQKTKAEMLQHIMTAYGVPLQVAERIWSTNVQVAEQARGHDLTYKVGMANANTKAELNAIKMESERQKLEQGLQRMQIQMQGVLNKNPEYNNLVKRQKIIDMRIDAAKGDPDKLSQLQDEKDKLNTEMSNFMTKFAGGIGGLPTGGSTAPAASTAPGYDPSKVRLKQ